MPVAAQHGDKQTKETGMWTGRLVGRHVHKKTCTYLAGYIETDLLFVYKHSCGGDCFDFILISQMNILTVVRDRIWSR